MKIMKKKIEDLKNDDNNARMHDSRNIKAIKKSLEEFGQQKPIVINEEGKVIAGNGTLEAATELGWSSVAVVITDLEEAKQSGYAIADNRTGELSGWDTEVLVNIMGDLTDKGFDLDSIGFNQVELDNLFGSLDDLNVEPAQTSDNEGGYNRTKEDYESSTIRSLHLFYEQEAYSNIIDAMEAEKQKRKLSTHADLVAFLFRDLGYEI